MIAAVGLRIWLNPRHTLNLSDLQTRAHVHPYNSNDLIAYGDALLQAGKLDEAMNQFAAACRLSPGTASPFTGLGVVALQERKYLIAQANLKQSVKNDPHNSLVWFLLGEADSHLHKDQIAIKDYQQSVHLKPQNEAAWRQLGVLQTKRLLLAQGYQALQKAVTLKPDDLQAQSDFGSSALAQGQLTQAQQAYRKILASRPDDPEALTGEAQTEMQLDTSPAGLKKAEIQVQKALSLRPSSISWLTLGNILLIQRRYAQAIPALTSAIASDPKRTSAYILLSQAYSAVGNQRMSLKVNAEYRNIEKNRFAHGNSPRMGR